MNCGKCSKPMEWQNISKADQEVAGILGYWYCFDCECQDTRPAQERYPDSDIFWTSSASAIIGISADTLRRLYNGKAKESLSFMHREGTQLITHSNSVSAYKLWYEEKKRTDRQEQSENYEPHLIRNISLKKSK